MRSTGTDGLRFPQELRYEVLSLTSTIQLLAHIRQRRPKGVVHLSRNIKLMSASLARFYFIHEHT